MKTKVIDLNLNKDIKIIDRKFIHSCYKKLPYGDVVIIKEKVRDDQNNIFNNIRCIENPKRTFYVTKPEYRNHKYKKEYEKIDKLDEYQCFNYDIVNSIKQVLNLNYSSVKNLKTLCNNPYIYKADIPIEALIKMSYLDKYPDGLYIPLDIGFLDIETDESTRQIIIISYSHNNIIYTSFLKSRMYQLDDNNKLNPFTLDTLIKKANEFYKNEIEEYNIKIHFHEASSEIDMIKWIFSKIHSNKTDFIGIWNMDFDISRIIERLKYYKIDPADIFNHPDIPKKYRYFKYKRDNFNVSHFTLKWHWVYNTSYSQFIDSMGLYSQLRKTAGFEDSYKLENILTKHLNKGKVLNLNIKEHIHYANKRFLDYIIYNIYDVMGLYLLELKIKDFTRLTIESSTVPVNLFSYATKNITFDHYYFFKQLGYIISSAGNSMITEETLIKKYFKTKYNINLSSNEVIPKYGGAVLRNERCKEVGIYPFDKNNMLDYKNETLVSLLVSDIDLTSAYPTNQGVYQISKSTADTCLFFISGHSRDKIYDLFGNLVALKENANYICNEYFKLPNYLDL